ncbi:MAG: hypothetical protein ACOZNI_13820, partial [Myxococcota bacterium]
GDGGDDPDDPDDPGDDDPDTGCDFPAGDRDGDGIADADDPWPDHVVVDDVHLDFDDLSVGDRVQDQYASLGVHIAGAGSPGDGYDSNVVERAGVCTSAVVETMPNVLCTYVNEGFNFEGDPGLAGSLDTPADAVTVRLYNAGIPLAESSGNERDMAILKTYDASGNELGTHSEIADVNDGHEYVDLQVMGDATMSFSLWTGDFDAVDDVHVLRLAPPECP